MCYVTNENCVKIPYDLIRQAAKPTYRMVLTGKDVGAVIEAVNQGIDSHLEACFVPDRGDSYTPGERKLRGWSVVKTLVCKISTESLPVLIRRLFEAEDENANNLASNILHSINIDEYGKYNSQED